MSNSFYNPNFPYTNSFQSGFRVYPVANIEEANACQVDTQGSPLYFHNKSQNEIYYKRFDINTGLVEFVKFVRSNEPLTTVKPNLDINTYKNDLTVIKKQISELFEIVKKDKAVTNDE